MSRRVHFKEPDLRAGSFATHTSLLAASGGLIQNTSSKMELLRALDFLKLNQLSSGWVDTTWDQEFTEAEPLDSAVEDSITAGGHKAFRKLYERLLPYAADSQASSTGTDESAQSIWTLFGENGVSTRSLLALLSYFILEGKAKAASVQQRLNGLHAASLYLLLLGVTGSVANKVFHQVLFDTCLDMVSHCWPQSSGKKRKKDSLKSSQAEGKRSKPQRKDNEEMEVDEAEDDEEEEEVHFSGQDLMKIRDYVVLLVQTLLQLLQKFPLKDKPQSADNCAKLFIKLIDFEPVTKDFTFGSEKAISDMQMVPELSFCGLWLLCSPNHGDVEECLRRVLSRLVYVILMMRQGNRGRHTLLMPTQAVHNARDQAIHFVCHIVENLKEPALPFLRVLLQHICFKMVEKCEYRNYGAQAMSTLLSKMPCSQYASFIKWFNDYSQHTKVAFRMFSLDVVLVLLQQPERKPDESVSPELVPFLPQSFLVQNVLFARWTDISPTVRGHALGCMAQWLDLSSINATHSIHELFGSSGARTMMEGYSTEGTRNSLGQKTYRTLAFNTVHVTKHDHTGDNTADRTNTHPEQSFDYKHAVILLLVFTLSCTVKERLAYLMQRVGDPKTTVRKHALQALMGFLKHNLIVMSAETLGMLSDRCRDPAVSVKKKALVCMGELLNAKPENPLVQRAWLQGVVPAVVDAESSVQEKALECLAEVLLDQVKNYSCHMDAAQKLTWDLLGLLCHECRDLSRYFSKAFTVWSKQNKFTPAFVNNLISHTEAEHAAGAWLLLSKVAGYSPKLNCGKILDAWDDMIRLKGADVTTSCHILCVMGDIAEYLNEDTKSRVVDDIMKWLKGFNLPLEVISASVETLCQLGRSEDMKQTQAFLNQHCGELVSACEVYLSSIIFSADAAQNLKEELMVKHLHTLGVASLHCPAKVGKRTVLLVQTVLTSGMDSQEDPDELPISQPLSQFRANSMPSTVRAHAVITLGKLCLQHEEVTQKFLPVFARELELGLGSEVAVRNNVVVIMCDLCVRYTNMVDRYIPNISACLRDDRPVIRKQTLIMLTNLLQEEFVKWKGSLFFRFVAVLVDPDPAIASLCEYCLVHLLLKKNPVMFSQHFIECIFHFNSYDKHKTYNRFPQTSREKTLFSLKGAQNRERRFRIYRFLLESFTDTQRFNTVSHITQNVLACFADGDLPLDSDGADILAETFGILGLKEMKLQAMMAPAGEEEQDEENMAAMAKVVVQEAQRKLVSQVQKKVFIENTIPIIIVLKSMLEKNRSPVVKDLMAYLQATMQDYRAEVKDFFSADEQLAAELEYDLKMYEKERDLEKQRDMEKEMDKCNLSGPTTPTTESGSVLGSPSPAVRARSLQVGFTTPQAVLRSGGLVTPRLVQTARNPGARLRVLSAVQLQSRGVGARCSLPLEASVIPKNRQGADRAISTPLDLGPNVTFGAGVSAIFSEENSGMESEGSILHMMNPQNQQAPTPRQWNVQSPLRQRKPRQIRQ